MTDQPTQTSEERLRFVLMRAAQESKRAGLTAYQIASVLLNVTEVVLSWNEEQADKG